MAPSISDLPNEVGHQILEHLCPVDFWGVQLVCRRFYQLINSLNWRHLCCVHFKYWDPKRTIKDKLRCNATDTDWKRIFLERFRIDCDTTTLLNSILANQVGRINKIQHIIDFGYDSKDTLLRHLAVHENAEDVLARRYYSDAVLGCLHRTSAIKEWSMLKETEDVSLERALAAFDLFVLHDQDGDFDETANRLDAIARNIRLEFPYFEEKTPRQKAILVARYLRKYNWTGIDGDEDLHYHDLQNNFIGMALREPTHPSLPLISTAIFCSVAQRFGLDAQACGFPFHVVAIVKPPAGKDLDLRHVNPGSSASSMYLDPYQSDEELPVTSLISRLRLVGAAESTHAVFLGPTTTTEILLRAGRNVLASVQEVHRNTMVRHGGHSQIPSSSSSIDLEGAFYGALWASLLLGIPPNGDGPAFASTQRRIYLPPFVEHFETHFPTDVGLIEAHIIPLFQDLAEFAQLRDSVRVMRSVDSMPKQVKRRTREISQHVRYKVGQVFLHKRYGYLAVITGWDIECGADEQWMAQMRVHELARGKHQSFYHVLVEDKSVRYVAEENIEIVQPKVPSTLMNLAGKHFKRWDHTSRCFVSNIRDEYPDD